MILMMMMMIDDDNDDDNHSDNDNDNNNDDYNDDEGWLKRMWLAKRFSFRNFVPVRKKSFSGILSRIKWKRLVISNLGPSDPIKAHISNKF